MAQRRTHMALSSLIVMAAFAVSKVVGLLRERAIAHQFGATTEYDAYVAAFRIPDLLFTLIAGGALVSAFLPVFTDSLTRHDDDEAWGVASGVTNIVFLTTTVLAALAALFAPWLVATVIAPGFAPAEQALTADLMRIILVSTVVFSVSGIQMGILNSFQHFLSPAIAPIAYNVGVLFGALVLAPRMGIFGLAWGVVLGAVMHLAIKVPALIRYGFRWKPVLGLKNPAVRKVLNLMGPRVLGLGTVQVSTVVTTRLASGLAAGSLSSLNYAWVLAQMPQTILGTAIGTVAFPTLAEHAALGDRDQLRRTGVDTLKVMIVLTLPAAVGLWLLAGPVIDVLLRSGRFDETAAAATNAALRMFALGLLGHVTLEIVARLFYAQKDTKTPLYMATLAMLINIGLALALVGSMQQAGLALANSVAVSLEVVVGLWLLARRFGGFAGRELFGTLTRSLIAASVMAVALIVSRATVQDTLGAATELGPFLTGLIVAATAGAIGVAVYVVAGWAIDVPFMRDGIALVVRRGSRLAGRS